MTDNDRYMHPDDPGVALQREEYLPLSMELYDTSPIKELVIQFESFMDHPEVSQSYQNQAGESRRRASQNVILDVVGAMECVTLVEHYMSKEIVDKELYVLTLKIASVYGEEQRMDALITIYNNKYVVMEINDYEVVYIDKKLTARTARGLRPASRYDVKGLNVLLSEILDAQKQQVQA